MSDVDIALWPDVDQAADTAAMISFLDTARTLPGLRIAKAEVVAALRLRAGQRVLDVGSGTGEDALEMARRVAPGGSVVGVEPSDAMRAEAIRRAVVCGLPVVFQAGDAAALPLDDHSVDAARADTVLQHLSDPAAAVGELVRVTRPGGRVAILDFDQGTFMVDHRDRATTAALYAHLIDHAAQGWMGRQLPRLLVDHGVRDVTVRPQVVLSDLAFLHLLLDHPSAELVAAGRIGEPTIRRWWAEAAAAADTGRLFTGATVVVAAGSTPT